MNATTAVRLLVLFGIGPFILVQGVSMGAAGTAQYSECTPLDGPDHLSLTDDSLNATADCVESDTGDGNVSVASPSRVHTATESAAVSETLTQEWIGTSTYGNSEKEGVVDLTVSHDGTYIALGRSGPNYERGAIVQVMPNGSASDDGFHTRRWEHKGNTILRTETGYVVVGTKNDDGLALKLDSQGQTVWMNEYGSSDPSESFYDAVELEDGYLLVGVVQGEADTDGFAVRIGENGERKQSLSVSPYGGDESMSDHLLAATKYSNDGVLLIGTTYTVDGPQPFAARLSQGSDGDWTVAETKLLEGGLARNVVTTELVETADGNYTFGGYTVEDSGTDAWAMEISPNTLETAWAKKYSEPDSNFFRSVDTVSSGYVFAGYNAGDGWMVRLDGEGDIRWRNSTARTGEEEWLAVVTPQEGTIVVGGIAESDLSDEQTDFYMGKYTVTSDRNGTLSPLEAIVGADGKPSTTEVLHAIDLWANDEPVPEAGETLSTADVLELIQLWANDQTI